MGKDRDRTNDLPTGNILSLSRRTLLQSALTAGGIVGMAGVSPVITFAQQTQQDTETRTDSSSVALKLSQMFNRTRFADLPSKAIEYSKMIIASTLASAAAGSLMSSAQIVLDLAKEHGGRPEATVWFDGTKLPVNDVAHVNAMLSDAAASDDSDIRNAAHEGTNLASTGLAVAERTGATGQDLLSAMVVGYESAGRIGEARRGGRAGIHTSQIVAFGGVVAAAKLLKLTDEQMANAIGLTATTMGGLAIGTNSWAREYMGGNAALCAVDAALAAGRDFAVNGDMLEAPDGFLAVFGPGKQVATDQLTRDVREWDIVKYLAIKLVPGAHGYSSLLEAAINAARQSNVPPEEVNQILVSGQNWTVLSGSRHPKDFAEAMHSLPYFLASAVADKDFSWVHATPAKISSPVVARLIPLVDVDPSPSSAHFDWSWGGTVTIVTRSGARYTSTVDAPRGSAPRGIEWSDVDAKYHSLMPQSGLSANRINETLNVIRHFERVKHVSELTDLLKTR